MSHFLFRDKCVPYELTADSPGVCKCVNGDMTPGVCIYRCSECGERADEFLVVPEEIMDDLVREE